MKYIKGTGTLKASLVLAVTMLVFTSIDAAGAPDAKPDTKPDLAPGAKPNTTLNVKPRSIWATKPVVTTLFTKFKRLSKEPILSPRPGKFDSLGAFNPGVVKTDDGKFVMLYRGQDGTGVSRIGYAESSDGIHFKAEEEPILFPTAPDESKGVEDPRLSRSVSAPDTWDLTATVFDTDAQLALFRSPDLRNWKRICTMMPSRKGAWNINWTKSGAIVPAKIADRYWMYYMGDAAEGSDQTGVASSTDGVHWSDASQKPVLERRPGSFDSKVVEPGPAPLITEDGILLLYNGADDKLWYRTGWALFDKNNPAKLLARCDKPIFEPKMQWERKIASSSIRQAPNVVFVEGLVKDGDRYLIYYGGADCRVGVAETRLVRAKAK